MMLRRRGLIAIAAAAILAAGSSVFLLQARTLPGYVGCYTDFEPFVLAIGADLRAYRRITGRGDRPEYRDILLAAEVMHRKAAVPAKAGRPISEGWVFEPGGYADYPDFLWAGWDGTGTMPKSAPVPDVAWDSSHFMRWPVWIESFKRAASDAEQAAFFDDLRAGLANQMVRKVLVPPNSEFRTYRLANYMDGRNGIYRGNYAPNARYAPSELSGTFIVGWWRYLDDPRITAAYQHIGRTLPFAPRERQMFFGPQTRFDNAHAKQLAKLASLRPGEKPTAAARNLWTIYQAPRLAKPLWDGVDVQWGLHELLMPMRIGFEKGIDQWQRDASAHFAAFMAAPPVKGRLLDELHHMNFASQFLVAAARADRLNMVPRGLFERTEQRLLVLWNGNAGRVSHTGWGEPHFEAFKPYLAWKLKQSCPGK